MASNLPNDNAPVHEKKVTPLDSHQAVQRRTDRSNAFMQDLRLRISSLLQTTLDTREVVRYFFQEVQAAVELDSLTYRHNASDIHHTEGSPSTHKASYRLSTRDDHFGEIQFSRRRRFMEHELVKLESLMDLFVYPMRNALRYQDAVRSSLQDSLTGVGNRLALSNALRHEIELSRRYKRKLSILMIDIDRFKSVNDLFGHQVGDNVLKSVANIAQQSLREVDSIYRLGGEEFVVLLSDTGLDDAAFVAERLRANIAQCDIGVGSKPDITVSIGVAEYETGMSFDDLIRTADEAMYKAKRSGRNQVSPV